MADQLLEEIYQMYKPLIYNYLYRSTLNHHTAEELTQETFLKVFRFLHQFRKEASLKTWLFTIARNTYLDYLKKTKQGTISLESKGIQLMDPYDAIAAMDEKMVIRRILLKLSEKERTLIILRDQYAFTYREIAEIMGSTEGQVKVGLHRARKKFKTLYLEEKEVSP